MSDEVKDEVVTEPTTTENKTEVTTPIQDTTEVPAATEGDAPKAEAPAPIPDSELSPEQLRVKNLVVTVIRTVFDPEIPVNIYELGLIYDIIVSPANEVKVRFTLTSPNCPAAQDLPMEMERKIKALDGIDKVEMELTWDPTWSPELMSEAAKLQLNMF